MSVGKNIVYHRERKGFSQYELADKSGVSQPAISQIETETVMPRVTTLQRIADALDVDLRTLMAP